MYIDQSQVLNAGAELMHSGQPLGNVGGQMAACNFDSGYRRPYLNEQGVPCVNVQNQEVYLSDLMSRGMPTVNSTLLLRKDEWITLDNAVTMAARNRLRAYQDLNNQGLTYGGFDGMGKMVLEYEAMSDPGEAMQNMEGLTKGPSDAPIFQLRGMPLPITYCDFTISARRLANSRNNGMPIDTSVAEAAGRRVAEFIEQVTIGTKTGQLFGDGSDYDTNSQNFGYLSHPHILTKSDMTAPSSSNGTTVLDEILALRELLYAANFYGPFILYVGTDYDQYIDNDFKTNSDKSTRQRILEIDGILEIRRLDYLTGSYSDRTVLVQMTSDVVRAVNGMDITTMQWEGMGGMETHYRVMAIQAAQIRSNYSDETGIAVGSTS